MEGIKQKARYPKTGAGLMNLGVVPEFSGYTVPLRVQVPNNHILTQNLYYNYYYPKPKYLSIEYLDPLGTSGRAGDLNIHRSGTCHELPV